MFPIGSIVCSSGAAGEASPWRRVVGALSDWLIAIRVSPRDAVVLLPQVWHLQLARNAWADEVGGWLPLFETPQTLARSWAPASQAEVGMITFDVALDRLIARGLLAQIMSFAPGDELAMEHALGAVVQTAHDMARAAALVPPEQRQAHWQHCREAVDAGLTPGRERAIVRVALEWAALQPPPSSDVLFSPPVRVGAWVAVQAGGPDPLAQAVLAHPWGRQLAIGGLP
jgi:ATP-dependent helicase/nuclease subunit B